MPGIPPLLKPTNDEVKTIEPCPRAFIAGICALAARKAPVRLTEITSVQLPMSMSGTGCISPRSEEHTSELQSLMRISYAVFCLTKKKTKDNTHNIHNLAHYLS